MGRLRGGGGFFACAGAADARGVAVVVGACLVMLSVVGLLAISLGFGRSRRSAPASVSIGATTGSIQRVMLLGGRSCWVAGSAGTSGTDRASTLSGSSAW